MDNDVIKNMNSGLGIGAGLNVDDDQRLEYLRESHRQDAENEASAKAESGDKAPTGPPEAKAP